MFFQADHCWLWTDSWLAEWQLCPDLTPTTVPTDWPLLISSSRREGSLAEHKVEWAGSAWAGVIFVFLVCMLPCFLPVLLLLLPLACQRDQSSPSLGSLTSHNAQPCYQWELCLFPAFSTTTAIFSHAVLSGSLFEAVYQTGWESWNKKGNLVSINHFAIYKYHYTDLIMCWF